MPFTVDSLPRLTSHPHGGSECYGFTFEEFDSMREYIRTMYPDLIRRRRRASIRSKEFTPLNLQ